MKAQHEHFTAVCGALETKMVDKDAAQDARLDELDNTLLKHHEHFTNVCANADSKFSLKSAAQDERVNALHRSIVMLHARQGDSGGAVNLDGMSLEKLEGYWAKVTH